jgi:hypothetical protein
MGAILDRGHLPTQIAELLRLVGRLQLMDAEHVAIAAGVQSTTMISVDRIDRLPRQQASMLSMSDRPIRVEPDECVTVAGLASGAAEAAQPLARAIFDAIARP